MRYNQKIKHFPDHYKITTFNYPVFNPDKEETQRKERADFSKTENRTRGDSMKRAHDRVLEIALVNQFDYFVTLTISPETCDRESPEQITKILKKWLSNQVYRNNLKYLIIPEYHKDHKSIHFHGLMSGDLDLKETPLTTNGKRIYNINNWSLGYSTAIDLTGNMVAVSHYIVKYISKGTEKILGNIYYAGGKGLIREVPVTYEIEHFYQVIARPIDIEGTNLKVKYTERERGYDIINLQSGVIQQDDE